MAFAPSGLNRLIKLAKGAQYSMLFNRSMAFKSAISLDTLYPKSYLKLTTPAFKQNSKETFSGFIPIEKLDITYSASSGPGGQNVNKVHTKVDLRFKLSEVDWLPREIRDKMMELHGRKLTKDGYMIIRSDVTRSQQMNLADCMQKLRNLIRDAAVTQRQPSPETQEMIRQRHLKASRLRLAVKREESIKREMKRPPTVVDL